MEHRPAATGGKKRADVSALFRVAYSLDSPHVLVVTGIGLAVVAGLAALDFVSGPAVGFGLFYALAVIATTFHAGWVAGSITGILASGAGLLARLFDQAAGTSEATAMWNLGNELAVFAALVVITQHGRSLLERLAAQSKHDLLTGALNTRGVMEAYERERARAKRFGTTLTLAFIDLDNMKRVNDELGHAEGDEMLRILTSSVLSAIRETDVFGRVGGDEFALLMPDTDEQAAITAIQRLRLVINRRTHERSPYISVSVGVATFRRDPPEASDALRAADALMYVAKRAGGNRVAGRVLAWDAAPLSEFGLVFDIAESATLRPIGDDEVGPLTA